MLFFSLPWVLFEFNETSVFQRQNEIIIKSNKPYAHKQYAQLSELDLETVICYLRSIPANTGKSGDKIILKFLNIDFSGLKKFPESFKNLFSKFNICFDDVIHIYEIRINSFSIMSHRNVKFNVEQQQFLILFLTTFKMDYVDLTEITCDQTFFLQLIGPLFQSKHVVFDDCMFGGIKAIKAFEAIMIVMLQNYRGPLDLQAITIKIQELRRESIDFLTTISGLLANKQVQVQFIAEDVTPENPYFILAYGNKISVSFISHSRLDNLWVLLQELGKKYTPVLTAMNPLPQCYQTNKGLQFHAVNKVDQQQNNNKETEEAYSQLLKNVGFTIATHSIRF